MTTFSEWAREETSALRARIFEMPFNRELAAGTLSQPRFQFYMIQDSLYLKEYSRALAIASAKAPDAAAMEQFARSAQGALIVERALHEGFFERFGISSHEAAAYEPSPTCYGYTNFLLSVSHQASYEELVAAVLPCFWVYWDVGNHIAADAAPDNPYRAWIDTYSDPSFGQSVDAVIAISNAAADRATDVRRADMLFAFKRSVQYEWMFWDSAYRQEEWPVNA